MFALSVLPAAGAAPESDDVNGRWFPVAGLSRPIEIERDRRGVPTIRGESILDVCFGHGFVQAQDRFFQMDGARRLAAGEAAALAGPSALELDRSARRYRLRHVAQQIVDELDDLERAMLEQFTHGVNAALKAMVRPPFPYSLIQITPEPWEVEDTILIVLGMFDMLQIEGDLERRVGVMHDALPQELVDFLTPRSSRFDAILLPAVLENGELTNDWRPTTIPGPEIVDLREQSNSGVMDTLVESTPIALGSNSWAVSGLRTKDGRAILANDPHLQYMVPGVWYRTVLEWDGGKAAGLSLPGAPGIIIGTNDHVAWSFTNMMGDFQDLIIVETHPDDPSLYRTPDGYEPFGTIVEEISVRGRNPERLTLQTTRWGVVTDTDWQGRPLVMKWTALNPKMVNVQILRMGSTESLEEAIEIAQSWYGPSQNIVMADAHGRIAWTVSGYLPRRIGFDGTRPMSWACGTIGWEGQLDDDLRPTLFDPPDGLLFTANNRTVPLKHAKQLGGIWTAGTRASQIGELLNTDRVFDERDLLDMQQDTRVLLLDHYRDALLDAATRADIDDPEVIRALDMVRDWNGYADADQPSMHLLDQFRRVLEQRVISPLVMPCRDLDPNFVYRWFMSDEVVLRIIEERPDHLLPRGYSDWDEFIIHAWLHALNRISQQTEVAPLGIDTQWGIVNRLRMSHPLSAMLPFMADRLDMPQSPQAGHAHAIRVATPRFGASARMVVSPAHLNDAILQTPAGQSGDPNSAHYQSFHREWLGGQATPLMPDEPTFRLKLVPEE